MISRIDIEDMTDAQDEAPERIWADRISDEIKGFVDWSEGEWSSSPFDGGTEYRRADLARPSQAGDERVARLESIVRRFIALPSGAWRPERRAADEAELMRDARADLAAMDTPKGGGDE